MLLQNSPLLTQQVSTGEASHHVSSCLSSIYWCRICVAGPIAFPKLLNLLTTARGKRMLYLFQRVGMKGRRTLPLKVKCLWGISLYHREINKSTQEELEK